jgi:hypothetical protein
MIGLFAEVGPCMVDQSAEETIMNPYSWNNFTNSAHFSLSFQPLSPRANSPCLYSSFFGSADWYRVFYWRA